MTYDKKKKEEIRERHDNAPTITRFNTTKRLYACVDHKEADLDRATLLAMIDDLEPRDYADDFRKALAELINRHCMENESNTPDYILAHYLTRCLEAFDLAVSAREAWYGRDDEPSATTIPDNLREGE